jgi:hypothetical protein
VPRFTHINHGSCSRAGVIVESRVRRYRWVESRRQARAVAIEALRPFVARREHVKNRGQFQQN